MQAAAVQHQGHRRQDRGEWTRTTGAMPCPWRTLSVLLAACPRVPQGCAWANTSSSAFLQPLVPPLCNLLPSMFAVQRNSCYLYVASEVIKVFGPHTGSAQILTPLFHALLQEALR